MKSAIATLALAASVAAAAQPGQFEVVGDTQVSAMMMFLGNEEKVYILDKTEGNKAQVNGHPAWASVWDIASRQASVMGVMSNTFCASGMHLPNGSWTAFGGNKAIGPGGNPVDIDTYGDTDGSRSIRILNPCTGDVSGNKCEWYDDPSTHAMQDQRWYAGTEALADGSVVLVGGYTGGGYINRNYPNKDPLYSGGGSTPTYEYFPGNGQTPQVMQFMGTTSGLNSYAHMYLMPSGKMLVQANYSTILWDYYKNVETPLPDMPGQVVRVYPASGGVAMLPLTPANNYTPTVLFCGGSDMPADAWGDFANPAVDTWDYPASPDCQRLTPEPADGSDPAYEQDDDMIGGGRTMGQFIILPNGKLFMVNGASNGTAGYSNTGTGIDLGGGNFLQVPGVDLGHSTYAEMPYGESLAAGPTLTPAIYDPEAPKGSRWSQDGLGASQIPRLYHSTALLLPDGSVMVAGSNPNIDVNLTAPFSTEYRAEYFYPSYFNASTRPQPSGIPMTLSYGGSPFDITIPKESYGGSANDAAAATKVVLIRPGFTTHAMNMGQRYLQLNNTYTVNNDGSFVLHTSQVPPNANLLTPGPVLMYVVIDGVPSNGTMVTVGNGKIGQQPTQAAVALPASQTASGSPSGSGSSNPSGGSSGSGGKSGAMSVGYSAGLLLGAVATIFTLAL